MRGLEKVGLGVCFYFSEHLGCDNVGKGALPDLVL